MMLLMITQNDTTKHEQDAMNSVQRHGTNMNYENREHKPVKITKGKYNYRGYIIENIGEISNYYGGIAFRNTEWRLKGTGVTMKNLYCMCEDIDYWLDDPINIDENGENTSPLVKLVSRENNA